MIIVDKIFTIVPIEEGTPIDESKLDREVNEEFIFEAPSCYDGTVGSRIKEFIGWDGDVSLLGRRFLTYEQALNRAKHYQCRGIEVRIGTKRTKSKLLSNSASHKDNLLKLLTNGVVSLEDKTIELLISTIETFYYPDIGSVWDRFDGIYVLTCDKYKDRMPYLKDELRRIDVLDKVEFRIDIPNPFIDYLASKIKYKMLNRDRWFRCGYSHYKLIKEALYNNKQHILIMEDDLVFLKDKTKIANIIKSLPSDYDFAMFDKSWRENQSSSYDSARFEWHSFVRFYGSGCYALSRKGMERFVALYEDGLKTGTLMNNDQYFDEKFFGSGYHKYAIYPNMALQRPFNSLSQLDLYYRLHLDHGLRFEDYNLKGMTITPNMIAAKRNAPPKGNGYNLNKRIDLHRTVVFSAIPKSPFEESSRHKGWMW